MTLLRPRLSDRAPGPPGPTRVAILLALTLFYLAIPDARPDFTRFNCSDSESYLALSYGLAHGLGYTRSMSEERYLPHTTWPPGLPVLLMPAVAWSGEQVDWRAVKWTTALIGLLGVAIAWSLVSRISASRTAADLSALALALNSFYWDFSHQAMAEVPLLVSILIGLAVVHRAWSAGGPGRAAAFGLGLICGLALLIKGHAAALGLAPLPYLWAGRRSGERTAALLAAWLLFCLGLALPYLAWSLRNSTVEATGFDAIHQTRMIWARDPNDPESELIGPGAMLERALGHLRHGVIYNLPRQVLPGLWPQRSLDWRGSGYLALPFSLLLAALALSRRPGEQAMLMTAGGVALTNLLFAFGASPRFWVPVTMLLTLLIAARAGRGLEALYPRRRTALLLAAALLLSLNLALYVRAHERQPFNPTGPWAELAALFEAAAGLDLETVGVLSPNSDAFRLITGLPAPIPPEDSTFDHLVARRDGVGPQPPPGSEPVLEVRPWALFRLPRPMRGAEIAGDPIDFEMEWTELQPADPDLVRRRHLAEFDVLAHVDLQQVAGSALDKAGLGEPGGPHGNHRADGVGHPADPGKSCRNSVLEGLACGRPALVADTVGALAAALRRLRGAHPALAVGARRLAEERFDRES